MTEVCAHTWLWASDGRWCDSCGATEYSDGRRTPGTPGKFTTPNPEREMIERFEAARPGLPPARRRRHRWLRRR